MSKKDIFTKVEAEAKKRLNDPTTKGAAQAVLEYIDKQREQLNNN